MGRKLVQPVYFDNNSTTRLEPETLEAIQPFLTQHFGNPSSSHCFGSVAAQALAFARREVGALVGATPDQVFFCASATEAINWAVRGCRTRIVTSEVEHAATLNACAHGRDSQQQLITLAVDHHGLISLEMLEEELRKGESTVALLWANNETGVICPIPEIAAACQRHGAYLHVDAVQAAGKIAIDLSQLPIDSLVISSHKLFGPKGAGALIVRDPARVEPLLWGGGQERGRRSGTENVPAIVGFGSACARAALFLDERARHVGALRDHLESEVLRRVSGTWVNGDGTHRLPNTSNIGFDGVEAEALVGMLDARGVAVSTGSACHSSTHEPSHVIRAMTRSHRKANESVRFSLSHQNTQDEVEYVLEAVCSVIAELR
ncbi:MAG: cysteine desulfurase [Proteobacteria bacterium]|nr:cysteine desulfurase [Pseudomonadota bacterium]